MLPAVTLDRLKSLLASEELNYEMEDDERIVIPFSPLVAFIRLKENLLSFTGLWRGDIVTDADMETLYLLSNNMNEERTLPKTFIIDPHDDEGGSVIFEFHMPIDQGASDEQLNGYFKDAMGSFFAAEAEISKALPHLVTWPTDE